MTPLVTCPVIAGIFRSVIADLHQVMALICCLLMPVEYRSGSLHLTEDILSSFLIINVPFNKKSLHGKIQNYESPMQPICLERNVVIQIKHYAQYKILR